MIRHKLIIDAKDIQIITGRSERYAQNALAAIRKHLGKTKGQLVTRGEYCAYTGITLAELLKFLEGE